jgi:ATP synthase protein I
VWTAVVIQAAVTLIAAGLAWLGWGLLAAVSLAAGGGAIVLPNALLVWRLGLADPRVAPITLLMGQFVKIGLSVLLLWAASQWIEGLSWGALIAGLALALNALLLTPWVSTMLDKRRAASVERKI